MQTFMLTKIGDGPWTAKVGRKSFVGTVDQCIAWLKRLGAM